MKARIKKGAIVWQDHCGFVWPKCCPPDSEYPDDIYEYRTIYPDAVFECEISDGRAECLRNGYGMPSAIGGDYGNGSITVLNLDMLEEVE